MFLKLRMLSLSTQYPTGLPAFGAAIAIGFSAIAD